MADSQLRTCTHIHSGPSKGRSALINGSVFLGIVVVWVIFDRLTKLFFDGSYVLGQASEHGYGLFQFKLVHNTGAAWGMFGDSTFALGVVSLVVCVMILIVIALFKYLFERPITLFEIGSLALVFAGGLGNALDRFMYGYVVDFIDLTFMNFPVFNIADIGVSCGFVFFMISLVWVSLGHHDKAVQEEQEVSHE